jgi:colanic acid/amylovoran biosynthesis glycosyltransferase
MKLVVAGVTWPPETFIRRRLEGLAAQGVDVTVATAAPRQRASAVRLEGVQTLRLPHWGDPAPLTACRVLWDGGVLAAVSPRRLAGMAAVLRGGGWWRWLSFAALARLRPDVAHFEWNAAAIDYWPLVELWRCPAVVSCRGSQIHVRPHTPGQEQFIGGLRRTLQGAAAVHCVSEAIRNEAVRYGLDPRKARVIRPAVDSEFFRPPERRRGGEDFRVVSTGALHWVKGYEYALLAVRRLADRGVRVRFEVVGEGRKSERQRVQYTIRDLGLEDMVTLRGALAPEGVRQALHEADAFLLASVSEGISNAALEAMASGLPVVTTDCGGMREAVHDGVEGWIVPPRDPEAMAGALQRLAADAVLRERMGRAGRERVLREFTLSRQVSEFLALYRTLVS